MKPHYTELYPKSLLGGLLFCNACGARLVQQTGGSDIYYGCPNHRNGSCSQTTRVPKTVAEKALIDLLQSQLVADAKWVASVKSTMATRLEELANEIPHEEAQLQKRREQLTREISNATNAILAGGAGSEALARALQERETSLKEVDAKLQELQQLDPHRIVLPDDAWIAKELADLRSILQEDAGQSALLLRTVFDKIMVEEVVMLGKKRGHIRLHVRLHGMAILKERDPKLPSAAFPDGASESEEIVLTIGKQSRMDTLAVKVLAMRQEGMSFHAIDKILKIGTGNISNILKRVNAS